MMHIFYCAWLKTQVETCHRHVLGTFKAQVETRLNMQYGEVALKYKWSRLVFRNESSSKLTLKCSQLLCASLYLHAGSSYIINITHKILIVTEHPNFKI